MSDRFFAIGSESAIAIWSKDRGAIGNRKIKDRDRKNAIFLAIVAFYSKYEVNYCKIAGNLILNFKFAKKVLDILLDGRKYLPIM